MLKKLVIAVIALGSAFCARADFGPVEFTPGQITAGARLGFTGWQNTLALGVEGGYAVTPNIRINGNFELGIPNNGTTPMMFNVDSNYGLGFDNVPRLLLYPVGGLALNWGIRGSGVDAGDSKNPGQDDFGMGLNLGVGAEWELSSNMSVFAENKECMHLVGNGYSYYQLTGGIRIKL